MADELYALTPKSYDRFRQMIGDGLQIGDVPRTEDTKQIAFVTIANSAPSGDWYTGNVVTIYGDGTETSHTVTVRVRAPEAGFKLLKLATYLCVRTGEYAAGVPGFIAVMGGRCVELVTDVYCDEDAGSLAVTKTKYWLPFATSSTGYEGGICDSAT